MIDGVDDALVFLFLHILIELPFGMFECLFEVCSSSRDNHFYCSTSVRMFILLSVFQSRPNRRACKDIDNGFRLYGYHGTPQARE